MKWSLIRLIIDGIGRYRFHLIRGNNPGNGDEGSRVSAAHRSVFGRFDLKILSDCNLGYIGTPISGGFFIVVDSSRW